ncbi:hypothetical protein EXM22_14720 [Oceanispirochaeta crateris]|uniref:AEC family transporter n=1 Tax=Oceanispirochaeta crateris TaxID=2518645 RepID=A0A5C1QNB5_9SPIO|nr:AEC family transporter [Oceanispirochaeta crateris]QEN09171.1 hypothetical protein EXM22_14720 [Oceanispirochaeta crateris]
MYILSILAPVLIIVSLGKVLFEIKFLDSAFFSGCTKIIFWVGLPALMIYNIGNATFYISVVQKIITVLFISVSIIIVISLISSGFMQLSRQKRKTFIHTSFHCNISYIGLPIIFFSLVPQGGGNELTEIASMAAGIMILFNNTLTTIIMNCGTKRLTPLNILKILKKIILSPIILACILGFTISIYHISLPHAINRVLLALGNMSLPLALIGVGARLDFKDIHSNLKTAIFVSVMNALMLPAIGYLIGKKLSLTNGEMLIALIFLAGPAASSSFIYAKEMNGDPILASKVILISTLLSVIPLSIILYLFI